MFNCLQYLASWDGVFSCACVCSSDRLLFSSRVAIRTDCQTSAISPPIPHPSSSRRRCTSANSLVQCLLLIEFQLPEMNLSVQIVSPWLHYQWELLRRKNTNTHIHTPQQTAPIRNIFLFFFWLLLPFMSNSMGNAPHSIYPLFLSLPGFVFIPTLMTGWWWIPGRSFPSLGLPGIKTKNNNISFQLSSVKEKNFRSIVQNEIRKHLLASQIELIAQWDRYSSSSSSSTSGSYWFSSLKQSCVVLV